MLRPGLPARPDPAPATASRIQRMMGRDPDQIRIAVLGIVADLIRCKKINRVYDVLLANDSGSSWREMSRGCWRLFDLRETSSHDLIYAIEPIHGYSVPMILDQ